MTISRHRARVIGGSSVFGIALLQLFNSVVCYKHGLAEFITSLAFIAIPMSAAIIVLASANPLRAVGACLFFAPWLVLAYVTDCVLPYKGGGASMIYVAVVLWGTPSAVLGALLAGPVTKRIGIDIDAR